MEENTFGNYWILKVRTFLTILGNVNTLLQAPKC